MTTSTIAEATSAKRECVFCGGSNLTKEHVFPQWITRELTGENPSGPVVDADQGAPFKVLTSEPVDEHSREPVLTAVQRGRPGVFPWHMVVKSVCASCNNGWMARLESAAQPIIRRLWNERKVQLTRPEVVTLVRWSQKMLAMFECWQPQQTVARRDVYEALRSDGRVPGSWDIRLARVQPGLEFAFHHTPTGTNAVFEGDILDSKSKDAHPAISSLIGVQSMFAVGRILFMVRYSPHEFRGPTSLGADYYQVRQSPATLFGLGARRIIKPGGLPIYNEDDLAAWALWSVSKDPQHVMAGVGLDPDGSSWVDDIRVVMKQQFGDDLKLETHWQPIDVRSVMAKEPRRGD